MDLHHKGEVDFARIFSKLTEHPSYREAGAVASFFGIVREDPIEGKVGKVTHLEYEAYNEVALKQLKEIREAMLLRPGILEVAIHHVIDRVEVGEPSLFVVVMGKHRHEVFSTLTDTVERVKKEAAIWKKEFTEKDSYWVPADT